MSVRFGVCRRFVLLSTLAVLLVSSSGEEARARTNEVTILIDSSRSMLGQGCNSTCKSCTPKDDVCESMTGTDGLTGSDGAYECLGRKCKRRPKQKCEKIWDQVIEEAKDYVETLDEDTQLYLYTFGKGAKYSPQPLEGGAMTEARKAKVIGQLTKQRPQATCTCLYNNMWELMDAMKAREAVDHYQTLYAFTDGLNDCSGKTLDELKERAKEIGQDRFRLIIKNTPEKGEGIYEPTLSLKRTTLSLDDKVVEGTVSLVEEKKTLFPFEVEVSWEPDAGAEELLSCKVQAALGVGVPVEGSDGTSGTFRCELKPDFAKKRPKALTGKLVFKRGHGRVKLKRTEVPVSFELKRWKTKETLSLGKWCQAKDTLSIPTPDALLNVLSAQHNHSKLTWKTPKVRWGKKTNKRLKKSGKVQVSSKAYHDASGSKVRLNLSVPKKANKRLLSQGSLSFNLRDKNGWVEIERVSAAIGIGTKACKKDSCGDGKCSPAERKSASCPKDCPIEEASVWPWLLLLLFLFIAGVLWLRRYPDLGRIRLRHDVGLNANYPLFANGALRVAAPVSKPILLSEIAAAKELNEPPPEFQAPKPTEGDADEAPESEPPLTQEQVVAWLSDPKASVTARYERPNVFLTATAPIFRRVDEPRAEFTSEILLGAVRGGGFQSEGPFRVLNEGQQLRVTSGEDDG